MKSRFEKKTQIFNDSPKLMRIWDSILHHKATMINLTHMATEIWDNNGSGNG